MRSTIFALFALSCAACQQSHSTAQTPGNEEDMHPYAGIGEAEIVRFTGTEPFWGGEVAGTTLTYSTPENQQGGTLAVERFAGRNGVSWSGSLGGAPFTLAVTPGDCSDGMSDRSYPFVAMVSVAGENRSGCAWTDAQPFSGPQSP